MRNRNSQHHQHTHPTNTTQHNQHSQHTTHATPIFQSSMTCQQRFNSIAESVMATHKTIGAVKGCPMHPKLSPKCRKCTEEVKSVAARSETLSLSEQFPEHIELNTPNPKSHFNEKLQLNIESSVLYRTQYKLHTNVKELLASLTSDEISIDAYTPNDTPTQFFMVFYRLIELRPTREQLVIMLRTNNVNVRCLGLLYLRTCISFYQLYGSMKNSLKDSKLVFATMTVAEYVERLMDENQLSHGGFRLPRIPVKIQREINQRISDIKQNKEEKVEIRDRSREKERKGRDEREDSDGDSKHHKGHNRRHNRASSSEQEMSVCKVQVQVKVQQKGSQVPLSKEENRALPLKERIRLLEQKNAQQLRRRELIKQYQAEAVENLESESGNQEQSCQNYHLG